MNTLITKLKKFFRENSPAIIVNTSTDKALVCLRPEIEEANGMVFMKFDSLNERGGNNVHFKSLQGEDDQTLYLENEEKNVLMLQKLSLVNYRHYIKQQYANAPDVRDQNELINIINSQK